MSRTRKNYPASFKTKVVIAALRDDRPVSELASQFGVHSTVIGRWRREALASMEAGFSGKLDVQQNNHALEVKELHAKIGQLTVERDFLLLLRAVLRFGSLQPLAARRRKEMVVAADVNLSITVQCRLLSISRSSWYYNLKGESLLNLALMRLIDEQFLLTPYYGSRQMMRHLRRQGYCVGRHRIRRLMRIMGLRAIYQEPRTSMPHPEHKIYPYLLRNLVVTRPHQVWCTEPKDSAEQQHHLISPSNGGFSIWWPSWTGIAVKSSVGVCPTAWMLVFALRLWKRLSAVMISRRSLTTSRTVMPVAWRKSAQSGITIYVF